MKRLLYILAFLLIAEMSWSDNTGPKNPATAVEDAAAGWSNIPPADSITTSDDRRSLASTQDSLFVTNFTMGVPDGATITAIIVTSEAQGSASQAARRRLDIHLVKNGRDVAGDHITFQHDLNSDNIVTLSGSTDSLWNTTWTVAEVNSANFGLALRKNATQAGNISVDHFTINVHYTTGGAPELSKRRGRIQ